MRKKILTSSALTLLLGGCIAIDQRADQEVIDRAATANFTARFANQAHYKSDADSPVVDNLANLLLIPASQSAVVQLAFSRDTGLRVDYPDVQQHRQIPLGEQLTINRAGAIELAAAKSCTAEKGVLGCDKKRLLLFINPQGELVTIHTDMTAGVFIVLPYAHYRKNVAIFSRLQ
ncbi:MAG: hypothetical protein CSA54_02725 [Gammaproteobacteria bacterium]|nr:MAG: hypothetical protein CSA54_02725 [Gammaproteobacteria bacterium]